MLSGKRFGLESPRDLLEKLIWEREEANSCSEQSVKEGAWRAFNAAVTAWHICDWVWEAATQEQKEGFRKLSPDPNAKGPRPLQALVTDECRELAICRQLATGSKHFIVNCHPDPAVTTERMPGVDILMNDAGEMKFVEQEALLFVRDGERLYAPFALIRVVEEYWIAFFDRFGM